MISITQLKVAAVVALTSCCALPAASGALLTGTPIGTPTNPGSISNAGAVDWAYWDRADGTAFTSMAPTNRMAGGPGLVGSASPVNSTGIRGSSTASTISFSFDNGTSPATSVGELISGVFASQLGTTAGRGVQVAVTLPEAKAYTISLWVSGYYASGQLSASMPGATTYADSSFNYTFTKSAKLYQLNVLPDNAGDALTVSYATLAPTDGNSHALIAGVAVSAVPEPAIFGLLAPIAFLGLRRRTRSRLEHTAVVALQQ